MPVPEDAIFREATFWNRRSVLKGIAGGAGTMLLPGFAMSQDRSAVTTLIANANVVTLDPTRPRASALAIRNGLILATGSLDEVRAAAGANAIEIDAGNRTVIPGLNDSHTHPTRGGRFYALELRWDGVRSLDRALAMVREQAGRTPKGAWVRVVGGWSPYQFAEKRLPTPAELTQAAPDVPVFVMLLYSQGYLNAAGVRALGITAANAAQKTPEGTRFELTEEGGAVLHAEPNPGILYQAIAALPGMSSDEQLLSTRHFYRELARFGITSVIDAGGGGHGFPEDYAATQALATRGEMPLRVSNYLFPQKPGGELAAFQNWTKEFGRNLNLAEKLADGFVVEGAGEFLVWSAGDFENFMAPRPELTDRPQYRNELMAATRVLLQAGWPIRIHATYDESIRLIMDVFEEAHRLERAKGRSGFAGVRWAIDHAETASRESLSRIKALGGGITVQARMAYGGEFFADRYGSKVASNAPPLADIIEAGIPVGFGTDATRVASYNPWIALDWWTTGRTIGGTKLLADRHRRSREQALWLNTVGSAWFSGEDAVKGRLAPGQYADLAILSADYLTVPDDEIAGIESVLTMTDGKVSYGSGTFSDLAPALPPAEPEWSPVRTFGGWQG